VFGALFIEKGEDTQFCFLIGTLWLFNIAMENGPFIAGLPIKNGDFPWLC
jgi:hypothetical protein